MSDKNSNAGDANKNENVNTRERCKQKKRISETYSGAKVNIKVPDFSPCEPEIWFALLEGQFENYGITEDSIKFNNVIIHLDMQHAKEVKDIIVNPPTKNRYDKIKSELIRRLSASHEKKVKQLLTHEQLGDRKPSQFLRHLTDLAGPGIPKEFIKTIWSNRLPSNIQTVLASQTSPKLEEVADLADRIHEITSPFNIASTSFSAAQATPTSEIAELKKMVEHLALKLDEHTRAPCSSNNRYNDRSRPQNRRYSSQSSRSNSSYRKFPLCWYHSRHGTNARKCIKPCDFGKAGNAPGSR